MDKPALPTPNYDTDPGGRGAYSTDINRYDEYDLWWTQRPISYLRFQTRSEKKTPKDGRRRSTVIRHRQRNLLRRKSDTSCPDTSFSTRKRKAACKLAKLNKAHSGLPTQT